MPKPGCSWIAALCVCSAARAQAPDVRLNFNGILSYVTYYRGPTALRFYDVLGRTSTLQLSVRLESGYRIFVSERWEHIPNDPSRDPFEQYYIEDLRIWHVGKQFLPFGDGHFLRENVLAARADTDLALENLNIAAAICDGGAGAQQGLSARVGSWYGASVALGRHFGISPTSLDLLRHPEDTPGIGHGYAEVFGADAERRWGPYSAAIEGIYFARGSTPQDHPFGALDLSWSLRTDPSNTITAGWSHRTEEREDVYRLMMSLKVGVNQFLEPIVRVRDSQLYDLGVTYRVRL